MYRFICYSCKERRYFEEIENAQTEFNAHAQEQHEVVIRRLKPSLEEHISELNGVDLSDGALDRVDEFGDDESTDSTP